MANNGELLSKTINHGRFKTKISINALFTETQVLEYGENCFEAGFAKCDIVEAGLEAKETDLEINWILIKLMRKWQTLQNAKEQIVR